jgi:hypothetical protein
MFGIMVSGRKILLCSAKYVDHEDLLAPQFARRALS